MNASNLIDFYNEFATEEKCAEFLIEQRWHGEITCPKCGTIGVKIYKLASGRLKCAVVVKPFTVRVGTVFEDSMTTTTKVALCNLPYLQA